MNYFPEGSELFIVDDSGKLLWRGKPEGHEAHRVSWAQAIPGSEDGLVLFDYYRPEKRHGSFQNLARISPSGSVLFHAELPEQCDDAYVSAELRDGRLLANSSSCYRVQIELSTGRIMERTFTK